jgi:CheY-like chemotaxis protein
LALARRSPPDLIASDLHMPGEDGIDLIQRVKADPGLQPVPFVFLSSTMARSGHNERQALALGAVKVLRRPIAAQALLDEIEKCLVKDG